MLALFKKEKNTWIYVNCEQLKHYKNQNVKDKDYYFLLKTSRDAFSTFNLQQDITMVVNMFKLHSKFLLVHLLILLWNKKLSIMKNFNISVSQEPIELEISEHYMKDIDMNYSKKDS